MKKIGVMLVVLLLVLSPLTLAQANETDTCTGFSWLKCFLFGDADKRAIAGQSWLERGALWTNQK